MFRINKYRLLYPKVIMVVILVSLLSPCSYAGSRLITTGGATQIEGTAGGGIVPWAVISGYGSTREISTNVFTSYLNTGDYELKVFGGAISYNNLIELSLTRQDLNLGSRTGLTGAEIRQDILGIKLRVLGDLIYTPYPQLSIGAQYKHNRDFSIPRSVGARNDDGIDFYASASKLFLAGVFGHNVVLNATVRASRANQGGLSGFGGDDNNHYEPLFEGSVGFFLNRHTVIGYEYRQTPDNLSFSDEDDWQDYYIGFFPNKHISIIAAYARLGTVAGLESQDGVYVSLELGF